MTDRGDWFTARRVRRLARALETLAPGAPGHAVANAKTMLYPTCGGPRDEIDDLLAVLVRSGLAQFQSKRIFRTRAGQRLMDMAPERRRRELPRALVRRGWFHDQVPRLLNVARYDGASLSLHLDVARVAAPQLVGLLLPLGEQDGDVFKLRGSLLAELDSPWCLIPSVTPGARDARLTVGKRGEAYSYQYLRQQARHAHDVLWVAADDESLGYDLEDHGPDPVQRIEVKASTEANVRFILSANEYRKSQEHGASYVVHFWGGVNLHRDPKREFETLLDRGFPRVYSNLADRIRSGELQAEPREWLVMAQSQASG